MGVDASVPLARADGLPSLNATAQESEYLKKSPLNFTSPDRALAISSALNVPIYAGGAVRNAVHAAETRVTAGQADLRGSESGVFAQVVAAYMDVMLGEATVRLSQTNVQKSNVTLQATTDRFQIGDLTRTDVAQAQSRLSLAQGNLQSAEANLISSRERYLQLVGTAPESLESPPPLPGLPASAEEAVSTALDLNPDLLAARQRAKAAGYEVGSARASRLPKLSLFANGAYVDYMGSLTSSTALPGGIPQTATTADVGLRATIPIFQGGRPTALIKQAQARQGAAMENEIGAERAVIAQVRSGYSSWRAANAIIASTQGAVDAATLSLEGVRAENSVGNRTILDILNAEQELVNAQVQLATARRNAYVAGFSLLAAMGKAEARDLGLDSGVLYDPIVHYRSAKASLWDWGGDPKPTAKATSNVGSKPQDGAIGK